jgi:hypothetical protein
MGLQPGGTERRRLGWISSSSPAGPADGSPHWRANHAPRGCSRTLARAVIPGSGSGLASMRSTMPAEGSTATQPATVTVGKQPTLSTRSRSRTLPESSETTTPAVRSCRRLKLKTPRRRTLPDDIPPYMPLPSFAFNSSGARMNGLHVVLRRPCSDTRKRPARHRPITIRPGQFRSQSWMGPLREVANGVARSHHG